MIQNFHQLTIEKQQTIGKKKLPKKVYDIALQSEIFELNQCQFNIRECYYQDYLLNGTQLNVVCAQGTRRLQDGIVAQLDNGNIIFYCGVNLIEYNPSTKMYKVFKQIKYILQIAQFCERYSGKSFISLLSMKENRCPYLQILDQYTKQKIYSETLNHLIGWNILDLLLFFGKKKYFFIICKKKEEIKVVVQMLEIDGLRIQQRFQFYPQSLHYNPDLNVYIFYRDKSVYSLRWQTIENRFQQKFILEMKSSLSLCISSDNIIAGVTADSIQIFNYIEKKKIKDFFIKELVKEYIQSNENNYENFAVSCIEFKQNKLLLGFQSVSLIICLIIEDVNVRVQKITFHSNNFVKFYKIMMDHQANSIFAITTHYEANQDLENQQLSLGTPVLLKQGNIKKHYFKISQIFLTILNTQFGLKSYRWEPLEYTNLLISPWKNQYFIQTNNRIIAKNWIFSLEQALCSAIHPTGLYLTIGFRDSFRIYAIISQGLINMNLSDSVRDCRSLSYSTYGNHLAVASTTFIFIYNAYTCKKLYTISHSQSTIIKRIIYSGDSLYCLTKQSSFYIYSSLNGYNKLGSFHPKQFLSSNQKETNFDVIEYDQKYDVFIACWQNDIKFFTNKGTTEFCSHKLPTKITCIEISQKLGIMFLGTENGEIVCFNWPNNPNRIQCKYPKKLLHSSAITMMKVTNDLIHLISVSQQGSFYICRLKTIDRLREVQRNELEFQFKNVLSVNDLLKQRKLTFHSLNYSIFVNQRIKQINQQIINENFMRPEEEERENSSLLKKIDEERTKLTQKNQRLLTKINQSHIQFREKIHRLKNQIDKLQRDHKLQIYNCYQNNRKQVQKTILNRSKLEEVFLKTKLNYEDSLNEQKKKYQAEKKLEEKQNNQILANLEQKVGNKEKEIYQQNYSIKIENEENFEEFKHEKNSLLQPFIDQIQKQKQSIMANSCLSTKIQKQINILNNRVSQLKESITQMESILQKFNTTKYDEEKKKFTKHSHIYNDQMLEIESQYIEKTKTIVKDTNRIQFCIQTYHKKKEQIAQLQEYLLQTDKNIDQILKNILQEKQNRYACQWKIQKLEGDIKQRKKKLDKLRIQKLDGQNHLKRSINEAQQTIHTMLINKTKQSNEKIKGRTTRQLTLRNQSIQTREFKISKVIQSYSRLKNTIKNEKISYQSNRMKALQENQDLIEELNSLNHQNKYLKDFVSSPFTQNIFEVCQISNSNLTKQNRKKMTRTEKNFITPFEKYHLEKQTKGIKKKKIQRMVTEPCSQMNPYNNMTKR